MLSIILPEEVAVLISCVTETNCIPYSANNFTISANENTILRENLITNCIPAEIFTMTAADYDKFLKERRILMAKKIKEYYNSL